MKKPKFFLIWGEGTTYNKPPYKHFTYEEAKRECERLTNLYGGEFHILAHVATAKKLNIHFEEITHLSDDIPF